MEEPETEAEIVAHALGRLVGTGKADEITTREVIHTGRVESFGPGRPLTRTTGSCEVEVLVEGYGVIFKFKDGELEDLDVVFRRQDG